MGVERNKGEVCMASREVTGGCDNGPPPFHVLLLSIFKQQHCTGCQSRFWLLVAGCDRITGIRPRKGGYKKLV